MNARVLILTVLTVLVSFAPEASARILDSELGRWTRRDPLGYVQGVSIYSYAGSAAIAATDPYGTIWMLCGASAHNEPVDGAWQPGGHSGSLQPELTLTPIWMEMPIPPPGGMWWYGNHCGEGHGSNYVPNCGPNPGVEHQQRCGENGTPRPNCRVLDDIDQCCADHDKCAYLNCVSHRFVFKSCCQQLCDGNMCTCLNRVVENPYRQPPLTPKQKFKIEMMRIIFCSHNYANNPTCEHWTPPPPAPAPAPGPPTTGRV